MHPCDFNAYNEGGWEVCEFKGAGHWLMDAANVIGETNLYVVEQRLIIHFSGESKDVLSRSHIDVATVDLLTKNVKIRM